MSRQDFMERVFGAYRPAQAPLFRRLGSVGDRKASETGRRQRLLDASRSVVKHALPLVPSMLREFPPARTARRRAAA